MRKASATALAAPVYRGDQTSFFLPGKSSYSYMAASGTDMTASSLNGQQAMASSGTKRSIRMPRETAETCPPWKPWAGVSVSCGNANYERPDTNNRIQRSSICRAYLRRQIKFRSHDHTSIIFRWRCRQIPQCRRRNAKQVESA